jgi:hypothetical protein
MRKGIIRASHFRKRDHLRASADVVRLVRHGADILLRFVLLREVRFLNGSRRSRISILGGSLLLFLLILIVIVIVILFMLDHIAVAVLLALAALVLARTLPAQNVALILGSLIAFEIALESVWNGPASLWAGWFFWPAIIVLARVGGRWLLRRRRQDWNYGVWLIVLASAVAALAQFAIALSDVKWPVALKLSAVRFGAAAFCLFWLSPWFISKLPQQPQDHAH